MWLMLQRKVQENDLLLLHAVLLDMDSVWYLYQITGWLAIRSIFECFQVDRINKVWLYIILKHNLNDTK